MKSHERPASVRAVRTYMPVERDGVNMADSDSPAVAATAMSFEIIEAVSELDGAGVSELARYLDRSKSGVYKHLQTLTEAGYLVKTGTTYHVGLSLWTLGAGARERFPLEAGKRAVDSLAASIDNTVSLILYEQGTAVSVYQQRPPGTERTELTVGDPYPLHATAAGKAILAYLPADERQAVLDDAGRPALTEATLTDAETLADELAAIRERRTAFERGEHSQATRGVAAPILAAGDPLGAIAVSGTDTELDSQRLEQEIPGIVVSASRSVENAVQTDDAP